MCSIDSTPLVCWFALFAVSSLENSRRISSFEALHLEAGIWPVVAASESDDTFDVTAAFCTADSTSDPMILERADEPDVCRSARALVGELRTLGRISDCEADGLLGGIWPREPKQDLTSASAPLLRVVSPTSPSVLQVYAARHGGGVAHG